ncbi:hypothetical protein ACI48D_12160 [Massilia sp. LXY-6]|uniref:hypothetical protein n=1 Tax=Massilia sp. LXY-6 TaxID=3379823 RepID=UPI003EDEC0E5
MIRVPPHVVLGLGLGLALAVARARAGQLAPPELPAELSAGAGIVRDGSASVQQPLGSPLARGGGGLPARGAGHRGRPPL